ncbi:MAG: hypothetical protein AAF414_12645 [Pseudomonadota bacterium]
MGNYIFGAVMVLLSLLGLLMAAGAHDPFFEFSGFLIFAFGVFFIFGLIRHTVGNDQGGDRGPR